MDNLQRSIAEQGGDKSVEYNKIIASMQADSEKVSVTKSLPACIEKLLKDHTCSLIKEMYCERVIYKFAFLDIWCELA